MVDLFELNAFVAFYRVQYETLHINVEYNVRCFRLCIMINNGKNYVTKFAYCNTTKEAKAIVNDCVIDFLARFGT